MAGARKSYQLWCTSQLRSVFAVWRTSCHRDETRYSNMASRHEGLHRRIQGSCCDQESRQLVTRVDARWAASFRGLLGKLHHTGVGFIDLAASRSSLEGPY